MILSSLRVLFIILEVILLFNLIIIVHELGHFLAARWRGLVVERFGIWFGKPLWKKTIGGVQYSLGCIPAGGFVALPQMAPMESIEGKNITEGAPLPPIKPLDKIIVAFAGPLFSFLLALVFACVIWLVGRPVAESEGTRVVGYALEGGPAAQAGLLPGDEILEVDGKPVTRFAGMVDSVIWNVVRSEGETVVFKVQRGSEVLELETTPVKEDGKGWSRSGLRQVLLEPKLTPVIMEVQSGTPAEKAGFESGDILLRANGIELHHPVMLSHLIEKNPGAAIRIEGRRGDESFVREVTPAVLEIDAKEPDARPRIGIMWNLSGRGGLIHPGPVEQVWASMRTITNTLSALFSPKSDIKAQHMSGPLGIMSIYYRMFSDPDGWRLAIWFSVVLNVNLAILNMLPLPVLDGGHITLALVEAVRRKPMNVRLLEILQTACAVLILGYMLYVTFYDVQDLPVFNREPVLEATPTPSPEVP